VDNLNFPLLINCGSFIILNVGAKRGYVSLFSGGGVGCYGLALEGFDCIVTSELIPRRINIQKYNDVCSLIGGYVLGDITSPEVNAKVFKAIEKWQQTYTQNEIDLVLATPPCQGISLANHKKKDELTRNSLVTESIRIIQRIEPRYFVMENVRGFLKTICTDIDGTNRLIEEAIKLNLGGLYNIGFKVINFKDYGSNSSRTRTLIIGVRKDIEEITPYDLFPSKQFPPVLKDLIGDLPRLKKMGEINPDDIYHSFRPYNERMLPWIKDLKEGESAFDNEEPHKKPHSVVDGKIIPNKNKNHDKYKRCVWGSVAPCVHTRNDILASQNTVHPEDPRVFSIRELMKFMTLPSTFKWSSYDLEELNSRPIPEKSLFLKKNEMNIRQCLGEGVPTAIFQSIGKKIKEVDTHERVSINKIRRLIDRYDLPETEKLIEYLSIEKPNFAEATKIAELANAKRLDEAAYYTRQDLCFNLVSDLPSFKNKTTIRILEPSVGVGNFLPSIIQKYSDKDKVYLDLVDISVESITILRKIIRTVKIPQNIELRIINDDFLTHQFRNKYDLVVGNPPFGRLSSEKFNGYESSGLLSTIKSRNIFALFIEKALTISEVVALFAPKSLLNAPEFEYLRKFLQKKAILKINDYGEKGFRGVKIETISIQVHNHAPISKTAVESYPLKTYSEHNQDYLIGSELPYWLIYRNLFFDKMMQKLELGIFTVYRDRSLTSKQMQRTGRVRVIKSRNILNGRIVHRVEDQFVDSPSTSPIAARYFNKERIIVAPNLSYYPRASFLPPNTIVDGSAAVLVPRGKTNIGRSELSFFASREFFLFYRIARNYSTRSLNIDSHSVYFWGLPRQAVRYEAFDSKDRSNYLFATPSNYFTSLS
jgi:DNA (cytosine-5)-methyltransferase 1